MPRPLRVLFVSAECTPFTRGGGLGEVARSLPIALGKLGHQVKVVIPWTRAVPAERMGVRPVGELRFPFDGGTASAMLGSSRALPGVEVLLVKNWRHLARVYGGRYDRYGVVSEYRRFWFFASAVAHLAGRADFSPDVVHCNDHHTAMAAVFLARRPQRPGLLLTIHNALFQGSFDIRFIRRRQLDNARSELPEMSSRRARFVNFLRRGIRAADFVNTVSPSYAQELLTGEEGMGLCEFLREKGERFLGILNGIDLEANDPARDPALHAPFSWKDLSARLRSRKALLRYAGLPEKSAPILAMVARLYEQKGVGLLLRTLDPILSLGAQVAVCGDGLPALVGVLRALSARHPHQLSYRPFDRERESLYYAGSDIFLMPSRWEPCGLTQLKAMRYGSVPVVRATGGLKDTVREHEPTRPGGNGFLFSEYDPWAFHAAVVKALAAFERPSEWRALQARAMREDFSFEASAKKYVEVYRRAAAEGRGRLRST
ncbi:MAG: glycogen/starch synthase [Myxococcales bacterium]|nr:glycogen/starch synthase [Myxococcales bacterium]